MRLSNIVLLLGFAGCTIDNPAFMVSAGDDASSGDGGGPGSAGSTSRPAESTGEPPSSTTATPTTATTDEPVTSTDPGTTGNASTDPGETTSTSTGVDPGETTDSTGDVVPVCGNGIVEEGEQCDDAQTEPAPGKCSPDCQAMVAKKTIFAADTKIKGSFMSLAVADSACNEFASDLGIDGEYKALISDGDVRVGSIEPYDGQATADWPLRPYTAYVNAGDQLVWITLKRPLLGVAVNNQGFMLPHAIQPDADFAAWTGLRADWRSGANCGEWTGGAESGVVGKPYKQDIYIDAGPQPCGSEWGLICVQQ